MMDVKPLRNERDYDWAVREVSRYFESEPEPGTADGDRFEVLSMLIKAYEDEHFAAKHGERAFVERVIGAAADAGDGPVDLEL